MIAAAPNVGAVANVTSARPCPGKASLYGLRRPFLTEKNIHRGRSFSFLLHLTSRRSQDIDGHCDTPKMAGRCAHKDVKSSA